MPITDLMSRRQLSASATAAGSGSFDYDRWTSDFLKEVEHVPGATDPSQSSAALRSLVKSGVLKFTDMKDNPEKFFMAHRLLSTVGLGGFGIRFTVQFNLFAGSIVGLGGPEQIKMLDDIQEKGQLGCFLLTEMQVRIGEEYFPVGNEDEDLACRCAYTNTKTTSHSMARRPASSPASSSRPPATGTRNPNSSSSTHPPTRPPRTGSPRATRPSSEL